MQDKHIQEKLSAYLNHELPPAERQQVAEHLLNCPQCRKEHDAVKLGAALASRLSRADAPEGTWDEIEASLCSGKQKTGFSLADLSFLKSRGMRAGFAALALVFALMAAVYFSLTEDHLRDAARNDLPVEKTGVEIPRAASVRTGTSIGENKNGQFPPSGNSNAQILPSNRKRTEQPAPPAPNLTSPPKNQSESLVAQSSRAAWNVEAIAGMPKAGDQTIAKNGKLAVGEFLETDANSRALVQVADIGQVEIAPNSRVQLVKTESTEHRLSLRRGLMQAKILAPPRLFIVDTPSAVAVDLGCEYTLEVDPEGNSRLHVMSGFVALELGPRESIVPAGAIALTKKGKGLGTPFSENSSREFQKALYEFDFAGGGRAALDTIIREANLYDMISLWHLIARVPRSERARVFEALARHVPPPPAVTRQGVLQLNKAMLDAWWREIENVWFE